MLLRLLQGSINAFPDTDPSKEGRYDTSKGRQKEEAVFATPNASIVELSKTWSPKVTGARWLG